MFGTRPRTVWRVLLISLMLVVPCLIASRVMATSGKAKPSALDRKTLPARSGGDRDFLTTL